MISHSLSSSFRRKSKRLSALEDVHKEIKGMIKDGGHHAAIQTIFEVIQRYLKFDDLTDEEREILCELTQMGIDCVEKITPILKNDKMIVEKENENPDIVDIDWSRYIRQPKKTLNDILGPIRDELKDVVWDIIVALNEKEKPEKDRFPAFDDNENLGNYLFVGPPGTAKTTSAEAVAGEVRKYIPDVKFLPITARIIKDYRYGMSEKKIRSLLEFADRVGPTIVFIDEIDQIAKSRTTSHEASASILNEFLASLSGINAVSKVVVIGATNLPELIDAAISGERFYVVRFPEPDITTKIELLHKFIPVQYRGFNVSHFINDLEGLSGRQIKKVARKAFAYAMMRAKYNGGKPTITDQDLKKAIRRVRQAELNSK